MYKSCHRTQPRSTKKIMDRVKEYKTMKKSIDINVVFFVTA